MFQWIIGPFLTCQHFMHWNVSIFSHFLVNQALYQKSNLFNRIFFTFGGFTPSVTGRKRGLLVVEAARAGHSRFSARIRGKWVTVYASQLVSNGHGICGWTYGPWHIGQSQWVQTGACATGGAVQLAEVSAGGVNLGRLRPLDTVSGGVGASAAHALPLTGGNGSVNSCRHAPVTRRAAAKWNWRHDAVIIGLQALKIVLVVG
jgi:hypothetical protein